MRYVVDASVAVKWYVPEIHEPEAIRLLKGGHQFHVPELIYPEIGSIIWKKVRRGEVSNSAGRDVIAAVARKRWTIHEHRKTFKSACAGAEATGQTVYDWTYLALAISLTCELVTADEKFYKALETTSFSGNLKWIGHF
ncbi:MAG: type II toxin-antitoxin system VapC family toxin [Acidobacteria bacterium]|nr:type II toxin-antitoxin system VapC family toxin [Acidobacteriota bacterium]